MQKNMGAKPKSVSELTGEIQEYFHRSFQFVSVVGEITGLSRPSSGHYYLSLKDENARISAVIFRNQARFLSVKLRDGMQVICTGRVSIYEPRGTYQLIVDRVESLGSGTLHAEFEKLKNLLRRQGYFARTRKKQIPRAIAKIALITSPTGAALRDFLAVCENRFTDFSIVVLPTAVQGPQASEKIVKAIAMANKTNAELIILTRGGGSIEDLWPFNEKNVAEAIYLSELPVISAIGHETDFTIADFCADLRCATPTAAAQHVSQDKPQLINRVIREKQRLTAIFSRLLQRREEQLGTLRERLSLLDHFYDKKALMLDYLFMNIVNRYKSYLDQSAYDLLNVRSRIQQHDPSNKIELKQQEVAFQQNRITQGMVHLLEKRGAALAAATSRIDSVSPLATLARGYSIVQKISPEKSKPVRVVIDAAQVKPGDKLQILLQKGRITTVVSTTNESSVRK